VVEALCALIDIDEEVIKLSKGSFLPLFLYLYNRYIIDIYFLVFVQGLFISDK
jgi:hypothetical protein